MFLFGTPVRIVIIAPQRIIGTMQTQDVIQLTSFQRIGAGAATTAQAVTEIMSQFGYTVEWAFDDTLIGQGSGGTDAVILTMPEVEKPENDKLSTNIFATLAPGNPVCTTMYFDMAAPREIISPLAGGATDVLTELRMTGGWGVRPESLTVVSMTY